MSVRNIPFGVYVPGQSPVHRLPAGVKFLLLLLFILGSALLITTPTGALACLGGVALIYLLARIPPAVAVGQILPVLPVLLVLGAFQWWQRGPDLATTTVVVLLASVAAAALLTLTTTITELMDSLERGLAPLARFGVPVEQITLAISLTIRLIPVQLATVHEVLAARKARGTGFSVTAFGTPVLVRSIRRARALAEALLARGVGD